MTCTLTESFADAFLAALERRTSIRPSVRVLDVGVGRARLPIEICARRPDIEFTGVDLKPSILRRARQEIERAGMTGSIHIQEGDACGLPFPDASFDAVIANSLIHHLRHRRLALREMIRVLRPGEVLFVRDSLPQADAAIIAGSLFRNARQSGRCIDRAGLPDPLSLDDARQLAAEVGLPVEWVRRCGPRHWLLSGLLAAGALQAGSCSRTV